MRLKPQRRSGHAETIAGAEIERRGRAAAPFGVGAAGATIAAPAIAQSTPNLMEAGHENRLFVAEPLSDRAARQSPRNARCEIKTTRP